MGLTSREVPSIDEPRNPPHTDKAGHVVSQPAVSLTVKLERMQAADSLLLRDGTQISAGNLPTSTNPRMSCLCSRSFYTYKVTSMCDSQETTSKTKRCSCGRLALAKLRPRHSHSSDNVGGRDVVMSTEDTHVGSSVSQIGMYIHHVDF